MSICVMLAYNNTTLPFDHNKIYILPNYDIYNGSIFVWLILNIIDMIFKKSLGTCFDMNQKSIC